jgi:Uma2 family endonuclease
MPTPITSITQLDPNGTYSYADYLTWQFEDLVELLRGKVVRRVSTPVELHQSVVGELHLIFGNYLRRQTCQVRVAPYDVRLPQRGTTTDQAIYTVVQPDICIICDPGKIEPRGCLGAPDLIVEVLSPGTSTRDWKNKFDLYEEAGVGEYWIVAPGDQNISVFVRDAGTGRYQLAGEYAHPAPCRAPRCPAWHWTGAIFLWSQCGKQAITTHRWPPFSAQRVTAASNLRFSTARLPSAWRCARSHRPSQWSACCNQGICARRRLPARA